MAETVSRDEVYEALKTVYDPEIPVNVVDLGLIYDVQVDEKNDVYVQMTLTFPGCGMGPQIAQQAEWAIQDLEGVVYTDLHRHQLRRHRSPGVLCQVLRRWRCRARILPPA